MKSPGFTPIGFKRAESVRLPWGFGDLPASDGHAMSVRFSCGVRVVGTATENAMFREAFESAGQGITGDEVTAHFRQTLRAGLLKACSAKPAGVWLEEAGRLELIEAAKAAVNQVAFMCGMEVHGPFELNIDSPSFARERQELRRKRQAEERAAARLEHLKHAGEVMRRFADIQQTSPGLSAGQILSRLSASEQAAVLQNLMDASAQEGSTGAAWAVGGTRLVRVNLASLPPSIDLIELPAESAGMFRSVQVMDDQLLIGADRGLILVKPGEPAAARFFTGALPSGGGFVKTAVCDGKLWGVNPELGLVGWDRENPATPAVHYNLADLGGIPRTLAAVDKRRLVVAGRETLGLLEAEIPIDGPRRTIQQIPAGGRVLALLPDDGRLFVILREGVVQIRDGETLDITRTVRPCEKVYSAALLPWMGGVRVLLSTGDGKVLCIGPDDDLVTHYQSTFYGLEDIAAAADVIVGLGANRKRLVIWSTAQAAQPAGQAPMEHLLKDVVSDLAV